MTTHDPHKEGYPIKPEVEKSFGTDEIFAGVKAVEGHELFEGFSFEVGRRGSKNATKGFSTGEGKTYCPGSEYPNQLTTRRVVRLVTQSVVTNSRHALNPEMGDVTDSKSDSYKERQKALVDGLMAVADRDSSNEPSSTEDLVLIDTVATAYRAFMQVTEPDEYSIAEAFSSTIALIHRLDASFTPLTETQG